MKNYHLYLWIIALVGLMTACSQDEAAGPQNEASHRVRIGTSINQALQTRAASVTIPENHKLRYVLEVWSTGDNPACIHLNEKTATTAGAVTFDFTLSESGDYKALLWADFVSTNASTSTVNTPNTYTHYQDLHYTTNSTTGLKAVELFKTDGGYVINDDARDAFFACITIKKETGAFEKNVELKRPFGQINVIEKNTELLAKVASMTLEYDVPNKFDVETGAPSGTAAVRPTVSTLPTATAARKANLFYDFIFTPATGQTTLGEIKLTFTDNDAAINLDKFTIPANMPAVRNKRTNISGSILNTSIAPSDAAKLTVTVSDGWTTPDVDYDVDALVWNGNSTSQPAGYDSFTPGEVNITTAAELAWLAQQSLLFESYTFKLTTDIDLNNHEWAPIGSKRTFNGAFDGQGHTVSNLKCTTSKQGGLFADIAHATVKDVTVSGSVSFNTNNGVCQLGGIVAYVTDNSTITGCTNQCTIAATGSGGKSHVGGIAGLVANQNSNSNINFTISNNTNTGTVSDNEQTGSYAGGIIGGATATNSCSITLTGNSYNSGTPSNVCIGYCYMMNSGTITIDENDATSEKAFPVPQP